MDAGERGERVKMRENGAEGGRARLRDRERVKDSVRTHRDIEK